MPTKDSVQIDKFVAEIESNGAELLLPLVSGQPTKASVAETSLGVIVGELIAIVDDGRTPMVVYPTQKGSAAIAARSIVDLHSGHIGQRVVLSFDGGDPARPIVMGVIRQAAVWAPEEKPGTVEVEADGARLVISAKDQLVFRCGLASITLTRAGKVLIQGEHVSSRSAGVNRIKGGSVQIN